MVKWNHSQADWLHSFYYDENDPEIKLIRWTKRNILTII